MASNNKRLAKARKSSAGNEWYEATVSWRWRVDRLAFLFRTLVERFGPHAQWEDPHYPSEARLAEYEEFLRAYDITAGIAALLIDWAREGGARRCGRDKEAPSQQRRAC